jgi:hypothetical protein
MSVEGKRRKKVINGIQIMEIVRVEKGLLRGLLEGEKR